MMAASARLHTPVPAAAEGTCCPAGAAGAFAAPVLDGWPAADAAREPAAPEAAVSGLLAPLPDGAAPAPGWDVLAAATAAACSGCGFR